MAVCNRFRFIIVPAVLVAVIWLMVVFLRPEEKVLKIEDIVETVPQKLVREKIEIKVFYETLCQDSRYFLNRKLMPVVNTLSEYVSVSLVPYGKATTSTNSIGKYIFNCQHGEVECYGNKVHACTIDAIKDNVQAVSLCNCMITNNLNPDRDLERCAQNTEAKSSVKKIQDCANGDRGSELLKLYGDETNLIRPSFIPTIQLNGSLSNQASLYTNLKLEVCKLIGTPLPAPCL